MRCRRVQETFLCGGYAFPPRAARAGPASDFEADLAAARAREHKAMEKRKRARERARQEKEEQRALAAQGKLFEEQA